MDAPIVEFPRCLCESVECCRRSQEYAFQPNGERFDGLGCGAGLSIDFDDVGGISGTVVFGEAGHRALFQLFDPLDFSLQTVADVDSEPGILGIENIPLRASLEGVGVSFDEIFKSVDSRIEFAYFGRVVVFPLFDCFK